MTNAELNIALYNKMETEQDKYRQWLLSQPPEEILHHTYEYTLREDILLMMQENDLTDAQAKALLDTPAPLQEIYEEFDKRDCDYMETLLECATERADELAGPPPVYRQSFDYAQEHGELIAYRKSLQANTACKEAIEEAIAEHYHDNHLDTSCIQKVVDKFGKDRVACVLAATLQEKAWDERFSRDNRAWAKSFPLPAAYDDEDRRVWIAVDKPHSILTDAFITHFRTECLGPQRESVLDKLKQPAPPQHVAPQGKTKGQER